MAYPTSALYKEAIIKESRATFIDGEIRGTNGVVIPLTNEMLSPGSFYITNQCVNSDAFEYGSVFSAELGITLKTEIDRYTLYDAEIIPYFNIMLPNKAYERIPLGVFNINDPSRVGRNITIKAYDRMINLEEEIVESTTGTPYELLLFITSHCNVSLAHSKIEIDSLINGGILLTVSPDRVSTYRELLSYICQITCTFATFNREGKLQLNEFKISSTKTITAKSRVSSKFSDFETYFSSVTGEFLYNDVLKSYTQTNGGAGLQYNMGSVPVVQGIDTTNQAVVSNVLLKTSQIKYTPCDISITNDASIDLGDMITNIDRNGNEIHSLVTYYKWVYRGNHQIKSAGQNPKLLKIKDKSTREIETMKNDMSTKDLAVYTYTNSSKVSIQGGGSNVQSMKSIANISFASKRASTCMVMVTIPLEMSEDSDVEFHQLYDDTEMLGGTIGQRCHKGKSTITFVNYFNTKTNAIHRYSIVGITKGVDGNAAGALTIDRYQLKTIVFGQGLSSVVQWDGTFVFNDSIPTIGLLSTLGTSQVRDTVSKSSGPKNPHSLSTSIQMVELKSTIEVADCTDALSTSFN